MIKIKPKEWNFVGLISLIFIGIISCSLLIGLFLTPKNHIFLGRQYINLTDTPFYYSLIEQTKENLLIFKDLYTSEPHAPFNFNIFWLSVGLMAKFLSLSSIVAYHLARFLLIPVLLVVLYLFISYFFEEEKKRKICLIFLVFASGLGGISLLIENIKPPIDLWVAEGFTFLTLYHSPHFMASLIFILLTFLLILFALETKKIIYSFLAGISALLLFQFHPYHLPLIFGTLGIYLVILDIKNTKIQWHLWKHYLILVFVSSPSIFYHFWLLMTNWVKQETARQNICLTPNLAIVILGYGFLFILALIGALFFIKKNLLNKKNIFLLVWGSVQFLIIYLPGITFQRRFSAGLHVVLTILAINGLFYLKDIWQKKNFFKNYVIENRAMLIMLFVLLFGMSNIVVLLLDWRFYALSTSDAYISLENLEAMNWLKESTPLKTIIFSGPKNGNLIPAIAVRTVYLGHWSETIKSREKFAKTSWFFKTNNSDLDKKLFLKENGVNYLFYTDKEKKLGNFQPEEKSYLKKVFENGEVKIFEVIYE